MLLALSTGRSIRAAANMNTAWRTAKIRPLDRRRGPWLVLSHFFSLLSAVRDKQAEMRADAPSVSHGLLT
jgi:hypothetical protein